MQHGLVQGARGAPSAAEFEVAGGRCQVPGRNSAAFVDFDQSGTGSISRRSARRISRRSIYLQQEQCSMYHTTGCFFLKDLRKVCKGGNDTSLQLPTIPCETNEGEVGSQIETNSAAELQLMTYPPAVNRKISHRCNARDGERPPGSR